MQALLWLAHDHHYIAASHLWRFEKGRHLLVCNCRKQHVSMRYAELFLFLSVGGGLVARSSRLLVKVVLLLAQ
jgi:hypothetical protein